MKKIEVPEEFMKEVIPFIQESCEIMDGIFGTGRTYDQMVGDGVVVKGVTEFVNMFPQYKVWTQAQENQKFAKEQEAIQEANRLERDGIIDAEIDG
jgi:hypothetical protein